MSDARLRLMELQRQARLDGQQATGSAVRGVEQSLRDLARLKERADLLRRKQDASKARKAALGFAGGTVPYEPPNVARPGVIEGAKETMQEKARRFEKYIQETMPEYFKEQGSAAVRGELAAAMPEQDPLLDLKRKMEKQRIANEQERERSMRATTAKRKADAAKVKSDNQAKVLERAVGALRDGFDPKGDLAALVDDKTKDIAALAPDMDMAEVRGVVANAVYDLADKNAKDEAEREKIAYKRRLDEVKRLAQKEKDATRTLTTQDLGILQSQKESLKDLRDLGKLSNDPEIRANWKQYSVGANEIGKITGNYLDGVIDLEEYERQQQKLAKRFAGDSKYLEFLRRTNEAVFSVGRAKNGPGVMTDSDLRFWQNALMDPTMSPEQFDNAMSRLISRGEEKYLGTVGDYKSIARRVPPRYLKDLEAGRQSGEATIKSRSKPPTDTLLGARSVTEVKDKVGSAAQQMDPLNPAGSMGAALLGATGGSSVPGERINLSQMPGNLVPNAANAGEAERIYEAARADVLEAKRNPTAYSPADLEKMTGRLNNARRQFDQFKAGQRR